MNSFLQQTAQSIIEKIDWQQLSSTTLVLPSHRAGLVLKDALLRLQKEQQTKAIWAPEVCTLTQLQDQLSPLYAEDELMTVVRLFKLYRALENDDPMPLDMFYLWGRQMLADFTNIDASMAAEEVPNFFNNTIAAREVSTWDLDPDVEARLRALIKPGSDATQEIMDSASIRAQFERVWRQLYELYKALRAQMLAEQKGYTGMRQRSVIEHWNDEELQQKISGRTYVFVGFNYLLPVEFELMKRLQDAGQALFYWDYVEDFQTNERAFSFTSLNSARLSNSLPPRKWEGTRKVSLMQCASREAQAQFVHQWLQQNYTARGQKVGVVICDETMLEPVIYTLPAITLPGETEPVPMNITKGFPLKNTQIFADVLKWLNDRQRGDANAVISTAIIDELLNTFFPTKPDDAEKPDVAEPVESPDSSEEKPIGWKDLLVLESEYQVHKIINQMRQIISDGIGDIPFTLKLLRLVMRRMMESITMPFHGEPMTDIQVMGVLETRLLDFDNLLILNAEEGIIPQRQSDNSFIPFYLRKAYHMQTSDERATVYAYNFFRLLSRAQHTTLLYSSPDSAEAGKGMSRFVMQMIYAPNKEFEVHKMALQEAGTLQETDIAGQMTFTHYTRKKLSPSAINSYIACPRKFGLRYVKGIHEPEKEEVMLGNSTLGSFVHAMIEYIYKHYFNCDNTDPVPVSADEIENIRTDKAKMNEALLHAYKELKEYEPEHHAGENVYILNYVDHILERDREDARKGLKIWKLEKDCTFKMQLEKIGTIELFGKVDRLDIIGEGTNERIRVVDYKTGKYVPDDKKDPTVKTKLTATWDEVSKDTQKDYIRQTLIYSCALMDIDNKTENGKTDNVDKVRPIEPNLFFCQQKLIDNAVVTNLMVDNKVVSDVREIKDALIKALKPTLQEMYSTTEFPLCEEGKCPKYCPYFRLCGRKPKDY